MRKWIIGAFVLAMFAGCTTTPTPTAPIEDRTPSMTAPSAGSGATTSGATTTGVSGTPGGSASAGAVNPLRDPANILSKRSVYFDYDQTAIRVVDGRAEVISEGHWTVFRP